MKIQNPMSIYEKLNILSDAAKYDVACTSSGTKRKGDGSGMGNCTQCGICHSFSADGRCISLLKVLMTNHCVYDCKYCANRVSNDTERTAFTPRELCELTVEFYKRNYIEGLFLRNFSCVSIPDISISTSDCNWFIFSFLADSLSRIPVKRSAAITGTAMHMVTRKSLTFRDIRSFNFGNSCKK